LTGPMRRAFWVFLATAGIGLAVVAVVVHKAWTYPDRPGGTARGKVELEIPKGATAGEVAALLEQAGLVDDPTLFRLYTGQRGAAARIRPGRYRFEAPATPKQLVDLLVKGVADQLVSVTVPEGRNIIEVAEILESAGVVSKTDLLAQAMNSAFARSLELPGPTLEGYLFPDTYRLRPRMPAREVALHLVRRHRQVFEELRAAHAEGLGRLRKALGFEDHQVVVLASIVEKETGQPEERPRIAQVFINRLVKPTFQPKLLQTDPTIIYGCAVAPLHLGRTSEACKGWNGDIKRVHLTDRDNDYNTYTREGLPPGPIANPGRAALAAVMKPDGSPYLYFVSYGDGSGRHFFSSTIAEHEAAVVKYQRGGKPFPAKRP
jgi:UPF0755 protein